MEFGKEVAMLEEINNGIKGNIKKYVSDENGAVLEIESEAGLYYLQFVPYGEGEVDD